MGLSRALYSLVKGAYWAVSKLLTVVSRRGAVIQVTWKRCVLQRASETRWTWPRCSKGQRNRKAPQTTAIMLDKLTEHPNVALFFLALGVLSCAKFAFKATGVLLQTFLLPGTGVSYILLC